MKHAFKRVVTGVGPDGRSTVSIEDNAPNRMKVTGWEGVYLCDLWTTAEMPVNNSGALDRGAQEIKHDPAPSGTIFRIAEFPPDDSNIDVAASFAAMGSKNVPGADLGLRHPSMHLTNTIDYMIIISGEVDMLLDDCDVPLGPGDCIVQRGTMHGWRVRGDKPCVIAAVLIDAIPNTARDNVIG